MHAYRALQTAFSSLMTTQMEEVSDKSQETSPMYSATATLDLATLTPVNISNCVHLG